MEITGVNWLGIYTDKVTETRDFFQTVLGLRLAANHENFVRLVAPNGSKVEIFGPGDESYGKLAADRLSGGFDVTDIEAAREELIAAGIEVIGPIESYGKHRWQKFRGPDGNLYEISEK